MADDVQVNTYTTGAQRFPTVALDVDGDFVVVWDSGVSAGSDASSLSIQGQRYASDGTEVGSQFQINTYYDGAQSEPFVAMEDNGDFVAVWYSDGSVSGDSSGRSIQGQRYASNGTKIGGEFQVNTYTSNDQRYPSVSSDADGDFIAVWESGVSSGSDSSSSSIQGQRYASDGSTVGFEFQVNTYTTDNQFRPSVASDSDGDFVVVWTSEGSSGTDTGFSIQGQRYASNGSTVGGEFQVNTYTSSDQVRPKVAMDADGDFVVVWQSAGSSGTDAGIAVLGQRYASDGTAAGSEFQINTSIASSQITPFVSMDDDGDTVAVWASQDSAGDDSSSFSVQGQRYASDGSTIGDEFQVNTYTFSYQWYPAVSMDADDDFVVVWASNGSDGMDTASTSIQKSGVGFVPVELMTFAIE